jgi:hypothetical protein
MGTLGGKIAFLAAPFLAFGLLPLTADWILCPGFFEEGCGANETMSLIAALLAALALAALPALAIRAVINRWMLRPSD